MSKKKLESLSLATFVAHPIDEIKCAGGLFAKYSRKGHKVTNVIFQKALSRGELSSSLSKEEIFKEAERESKAASAKIGAEVELLNYEPLSMSIVKDEEEVVRRVADIIRRLKIDIVITHQPGDTSYGTMHHDSVNRIVEKACHFARDETVETTHDPYKVKLLLYAEMNLWTPQVLTKMPDLFIDISDVAKIKAEALAEYTLHIGKPAPDILRESRMVSSRMEGIVSGCRYAEAFYFPYDRYPYGRRAFDEIPRDWFSVPKTEGGHEKLSLPNDF